MAGDGGNIISIDQVQEQFCHKMIQAVRATCQLVSNSIGNPSHSQHAASNTMLYATAGLP